jgi:hypothetical protein
MNYSIRYEYFTFEACGDGCCHESESNVEIYGGRIDAYETTFSIPSMWDEQELREYIDTNYPEYSGFVLLPGSRFVW